MRSITIWHLEERGFRNWPDVLLKDLLPSGYNIYKGNDAKVNDLITIRDILAHRTGLRSYDMAWVLMPDVSREHIWRYPCDTRMIMKSNHGM